MDWAKFDNLSLVAVILHKYAISLDSGGVSRGRSFESRILDLVIALMSNIDISQTEWTDIDKTSYWAILEHAESRISVNDVGQQAIQLQLFDELDLANNLQLARQLLTHLNIYQLFICDGAIVPLLWKSCINTAVLLLAPPSHLNNIEDVVSTSENRLHELREYRYHNLCEFF